MRGKEEREGEEEGEEEERLSKENIRFSRVENKL